MQKCDFFSLGTSKVYSKVAQNEMCRLSSARQSAQRQSGAAPMGGTGGTLSLVVAVGQLLLALSGPKHVVFGAVHSIRNAALLKRRAHHGRRDCAQCILRPSGEVWQKIA